MHVITGLDTGGAETMLLKLLSRTNRQKFSPTVVSLTHKGDLSRPIEGLGVPVHALGMQRGVPTPWGLSRLVRLIRNDRPRVIQGWMYHANLAAQLSALLANQTTPVLWNVRSSYQDLVPQSPLTEVVIRLCGRLSGLPKFIINNSRNSAQVHERRLGYRADKWRIVPSGVDTEAFVPSDDARRRLRASLGVPRDALLISLIARYDKLKDHRTFLRAASIFLRRQPDAHFVLIGTGVSEDNEELLAHLGEEPLRRAVHLLGRRDDIHFCAAAMDIATSSSVVEGFSNAIAEAMSCGVPCVVTDVGDSAWIVGETGRVVRSADPAALARAWDEIMALGRDSRAALGAAARQRVVEKFSLPSVVRQYEGLYDEVLGLERGAR